MTLSCYQWVVFLQRKQYCYGSQRSTSLTDYFINTWIKARQIIIYPLISVRCKVQDKDYNIHDASQRKVSPQYSVFLVLHFLDCKFHSTYARTYFVSRRQWNTLNERWIVIVGKKAHMNFIRTVWSIHNCKNSTM